jgi:hypothetical protein
MKVYASIEPYLCISYRLNIFADRDYELIPEPEGGYSKDPGNVVGNLTEASNQNLENFDTPAPSLTQEGKLRCITQYFKLLHYAI